MKINIKMTYKETINWLFNQLPMFQNVGASAYKKDLTNTLLLVNHLENPQQNFKVSMLQELMEKVLQVV